MEQFPDSWLPQREEFPDSWLSQWEQFPDSWLSQWEQFPDSWFSQSPKQILMGAVPRPVAGGSLTGGTGRSRDSRAAPSMVIAAFVRAKLFGIKILTLDARIALAPADAGSDVTTVAARARAVAPPADTSTPRLGDRADLAHAVRLLEEGSKSLDEVKALRSLDVVSPE